jgi:hypothetical protein
MVPIEEAAVRAGELREDQREAYSRRGTRKVLESAEILEEPSRSGTESGTVEADTDLATVVRCWSNLPNHVRQTIVGIVQICG